MTHVSVPETRALAGPKNVFWASKKLRFTGPNGIMLAQKFCDIFFMKKRHQISIYKQFSGELFFINNIKIHSFTSLMGVGGALQGNFGTGVQLKLRKHPNAYIAIK